jgi:lipid-A-disaccharide synthase
MRRTGPGNQWSLIITEKQMTDRENKFLTPGPWPLIPGHPAPDHWPLTTVLISAGEASGDAHAARLVAALKKRLPQAKFLGIGGEALEAEGVHLIFPASRLAVVGLLEVAERLPDVWRALKTIRQALRQKRPALVILVDFPDFNLLVARLAKWYGVRVMYFISPQVWAWRSYRVRTIAKIVDRMVVIFPFEAEFYRHRGVPVDFVGHPFRETLPDLPARKELLEAWGLDPTRLTLTLLPGSRASEIQRHLPTMLASAELIRQAIPEVQFLLPLASTAPRDLVETLVNAGAGPGSATPEAHCPLPQLKIIPGQAYAALWAADAAVAASGTVTVEAALAGCPTVIVYRVSPLTYEVGKRLVRVDYIGMSNLLAQERLFPELIQADFTPARLAQEVLDLIQSPQRLAALRQGLARVVARLGGPGASARAADVALKVILREKIC